MIKVKSFMFQTGYVESQSLSCLLLSHETGFDTVQEALLALSEVFRNSPDYTPSSKACCRKTKEKDQEAEFCSKCGTNLKEPEVDVGERFYEYIYSTCNDAAYWEKLTNAGWSHDTQDFDWANHVHVESVETVIGEAATEAWDKNGKPPRDGCWTTPFDYASEHVHFFNPEMKKQILK